MKGRVMKKILLILSAALFISQALISTSGATLRGIHVKTQDRQGAEKDIQLYKGYYALVVGCGNYSDGWPKLPNPVKDAKEVSMILKEMGWTVDLLEVDQDQKLQPYHVLHLFLQLMEYV